MRESRLGKHLLETMRAVGKGGVKNGTGTHVLLAVFPQATHWAWPT